MPESVIFDKMMSESRKQIREIKMGVSFVIGTPGRIKDLIDKKVLDLTQDDFGSINILFESGEILKIIKENC